MASNPDANRARRHGSKFLQHLLCRQTARGTEISGAYRAEPRRQQLGGDLFAVRTAEFVDKTLLESEVVCCKVMYALNYGSSVNNGVGLFGRRARAGLGPGSGGLRKPTVPEELKVVAYSHSSSSRTHFPSSGRNATRRDAFLVTSSKQQRVDFVKKKIVPFPTPPYVTVTSPVWCKWPSSGDPWVGNTHSASAACIIHVRSEITPTKTPERGSPPAGICWTRTSAGSISILCPANVKPTQFLTWRFEIIDHVAGNAGHAAMRKELKLLGSPCFL